MENSKIFMFPENGYGRNNGGIDPALLLAMNQNGGFGNGCWIWILFMWILWGGMGMNGWGMNGMNNGAGFLSNQINNDAGRELLLQALNGRTDLLQQIATMTNTSVNNVENAICTLNAKIQEVGGQVGMSRLEVINATQSGNAQLASQIAQCCCENRLLVTQQGYENRIQTIEQTNQLGSQADRNTNALASAIADLKTNMTREFCEVREREMQNKIDAQGEIITQLRGQISNDRQTAQLYTAIAPIQNKVNEIANKQPNTVPVEWPQLTAVSTSPCVTGGFFGGFGNGWGWNNGWGSNSFWN